MQMCSHSYFMPLTEEPNLMAHDLENQQPLLPVLLDPSQHPEKRTVPEKRRLKRCKSAPAIDTFLESRKSAGLIPVSKFSFINFGPSFKQAAIFLAVYLTIGSACFYLVEDQIKGLKTNRILDALYFCIVTMTTVGYGDLVPDSAASKLLACCFVFFGMAIVSLFLSKAADYLVDKQEVLLIKALHIRRRVGEAHMMKEIEIKRAKYKFWMNAVFLLALMLSGTIFLIKVEKLNLVDAFYCVCSTITTLGYGDKSFSTVGGRVFSVFWILMSTICVAQFFLYTAEVYTERRQHQLANWVLHRKMTFVDLQAADLDGDGHVGAAEFIIYKLKEMGKIQEEDIALIMEEFEDLDIDRSGTLSNDDLVLAQSAG